MSITSKAFYCPVLEKYQSPYHWIMAEKLNIMLALEKLTCVIRNKPSEFFYIWKVFLNFVKNGDIEDALDVRRYGL